VDDSGDSTSKVANPMIGKKLGGQYTIVSIIGEGGMGMIYHGRQDIVDREVAIKFLPQALAQDEINVQRLAREAKALGRLSHPYIVTTFDFGFTDKKEPFLVFEYVDGESLQNYLARLGALPYRQCVPLFIQLADAMKYAHAAGVVHRDIKPHNIMVVEKDHKTSVKVLDFGIAQMKSETQKLTRAGEIWGSPNYMSPEQCVGDPVDHLTDIYSLGVVMYRTLSSVVPNTGRSFAETVSKKLNQPVPFFSSLELEKPVDVPPGLEEIVIKCLRRYPDERFQSMGDLKKALVAFAREEKIPVDALGVQYSDDEKVDTLTKTGAVKRPVASTKSEAIPNISQSKYKAPVAAKAAHTAVPGAAKPHWQRMILPVVALLAMVAVAITGYFVREVQDDGATKGAPPKSTSAPTSPNSAPVNSAPAPGSTTTTINAVPPPAPSNSTISNPINSSPPVISRPSLNASNLNSALLNAPTGNSTAAPKLDRPKLNASTLNAATLNSTDLNGATQNKSASSRPAFNTTEANAPAVNPGQSKMLRGLPLLEAAPPNARLSTDPPPGMMVPVVVPPLTQSPSAESGSSSPMADKLMTGTAERPREKVSEHVRKLKEKREAAEARRKAGKHALVGKGGGSANVSGIDQEERDFHKHYQPASSDDNTLRVIYADPPSKSDKSQYDANEWVKFQRHAKKN
jgi:serine/threonine protein kinase